MNSITLNDAELAEMKRFYTSQLAEAESKVAHIRGVLSKLGVAVASVADTAIAEAAEPTEEAQAVAEGEPQNALVTLIPEEYTKRGRGAVKRRKERKSKWGTYITNILRSSDQLLSAGELYAHAMKRKNNQDLGEVAVRAGLNQALVRMTNHSYRLRSLKIEGKRGRYYGLAGWFNLDGTLKGNYGNRFGALNIRLAEDSGSDED